MAFLGVGWIYVGVLVCEFVGCYLGFRVFDCVGIFVVWYIAGFLFVCFWFDGFSVWLYFLLVLVRFAGLVV